MHHLIVYAHEREESFNAAIRNAIVNELCESRQNAIVRQRDMALLWIGASRV